MVNKTSVWLDNVLTFSVWLLFFSLFTSASGIGAATALLAVFGVFAFRTELKTIPELPLFWPIVLFIAAATLSVALAPGVGFAKSLGKLRYFLFYFLLLLYFARYPKIRERLAWAAIPFSFILLLVAALQFTGIFCPLYDLGITPVPLAILANAQGDFFHARGFLYHHNPFAYTSVLLYFLLLGQGLECPKAPDKKWYLIGAAAMLLAVAMSGSRGSWVSLSLATVFVLVSAARQHWRTFVGLGVAAIMVAAFLAGPLSRRASSIRLSENTERIRLWSLSWDMFLDSPITGQGYHHGFENERIRFMTEKDRANPHFPTDPHSLYFDLLATTGLLGFGTFLFLLLRALALYLQTLTSRGLKAQNRGFLITGLGGWICFAVGTGFDSHFFHTQTLMATLFFLALGQSVVWESGFSERRRK